MLDTNVTIRLSVMEEWICSRLVRFLCMPRSCFLLKYLNALDHQAYLYILNKHVGILTKFIHSSNESP